MSLDVITSKELKHVIKDNDALIIVYKNTDQMLSMLEGQVLRLKNLYHDKFKYFKIKEDDLSLVIDKTFTILPQVIIFKKEKPIAYVRGFRKLEELSKIINLSF